MQATLFCSLTESQAARNLKQTLQAPGLKHDHSGANHYHGVNAKCLTLRVNPMNSVH